MPQIRRLWRLFIIDAKAQPNMAPTIAKASCLYPNTTRAVEAKQRGFDNAVVCDPIGNVAGFAAANLFLSSR